jgi:GSCFA family
MPLSIATAAEARRNFGINPCTRWYLPDAEPSDKAGMLAFQRLRRSPFVPLIAPRFQMDRRDKVYAIGSCFARGIENVLAGVGMEVLSRSDAFDRFAPNRDELKLGFTNKYNVFSVYNELRWGLDPAAQFPRETVVEVGNGLFYDPHTNPALQLAGREETLQRRSILQSITARVRECRVVIITLGLAEIWRDRIGDVIINTTPVPEAFRQHPDRYEFRVSSFAENLATLEKMHVLLTEFGHLDTQIVVTVSPVPLMATFSGQDVVVANTYSKSMLRAAAQEWSGLHDNVHYFPSYEIVLNSDPELTWMDDRRHVRGPVVEHIMKLFLRNYLP